MLPDLIVCESEARLASLVSYASEHRLPFVPFRVVVCSECWSWFHLQNESYERVNTYEDLQKNDWRRPYDDVELQPVEKCKPPALVDLSGRKIGPHDWQELAEKKGCITRVHPNSMKEKAAERLIDACKKLPKPWGTSNVGDPSKDGELVWLSLGSYDNILAVRRTGLRGARERTNRFMQPIERTGSLASWAPHLDDEDDAIVRMELLKVPMLPLLLMAFCMLFGRAMTQFGTIAVGITEKRGAKISLWPVKSGVGIIQALDLRCV